MSIAASDLTGAKRRIIDRLKRVDTCTAPELAHEFGLTDTAIRQHLEALEAAGLVERRMEPAAGRGRPPVHWHLTPDASSLFADRHADLTVDLITSIRDSLGDDALRTVVAARADRQRLAYAEVLAPIDGVAQRVQALAELRSTEGYLAEAVVDDGEVLLVEHHCPIGDAASTCEHLCAAELDVFRTALGPTVAVHREQHLLAGDHRCAYRVTPA
ncbi:MAG: helix-turn-helix transcriptional regulator [Ilumatobacteraceae bacterium]